MKGGQKGQSTSNNNIFTSDPNANTPAELDWRTKNVLNPVQNQATCGSCWAFSAVAAMESRYALSKGGSLMKLSEQQLVDCEKPDQGCNGGLMDDAFKYFETAGSELESD